MYDNCVLTDSRDLVMSFVKSTELGFVFKTEFGVRLNFFHGYENEVEHILCLGISLP